MENHHLHLLLLALLHRNHAETESEELVPRSFTKVDRSTMINHGGPINHHGLMITEHDGVQNCYMSNL